MKFRKALAVVSAASAVIGAEILLTDSDLWEAAPSHAYGLIGFVIIDITIVGLLLNRKNVAFKIAMIWGTLQFILMLGDILTAQVSGFHTYREFIDYLFSLWNFDFLLILQPILSVLGFLGNKHRTTGKKTPQATILGNSPASVF